MKKPCTSNHELDFRSLLESMPGYYLALLPDAPKFTIVAVSDFYLRQVAVTREEVVGKGIFEISPWARNFSRDADGNQTLAASLKGVVQKRGSDTLDVHQRGGPQNEERYWNVTNSPVFDSSGELAYITHCIEDVTDFVRLKKERDDAVAEETAIKEKFDRFFKQNELILESAGEGIFGLDHEGRTTFANAASGKMLGWEPSEFLGKTQHAIVHHSRPDGSPYPQEDCPIYAAFKDGAIHRVDADVFWKKDGTSFPVEYVSTPMWWNGKLVGAVVVFKDITERKRIEQEREGLLLREHMARVDAEKSIQMRDEFLSIASHELRTPITPMKMHLQLLKRQLRAASPAVSPKETAFLKAFEISERQLEALENLTEDLLDVSRITAGRLTLNREKVNLPDLVKGVLERHPSSTSHLGSEVRLRIDENAQITGFWDPLKIAQIVTNLLTNALKYGRGKPIEIAITADHRIAKLSVKDFGIGISKENQANLFERFQRAAPINHFPGLGLGLFISKELAKAHGGSIRVESELDRGSTFTLELPLDSSEI